MRLSSSKFVPWLLFVFCLLLLGLGSTPIGPWADHTLVAVRFLTLLVLSVLIVRRSFRSERLGLKTTRSDHDGSSSFLDSFARWYRGERKQR